MSALSLCLEPNPVLRAKARPVETFTEELWLFASNLIETMHANDGIGLAAPQVGRDVQVFVANPSQGRGRELVVVNPTLDAAYGRMTIVEGCLSLPSIWERVKRASHVRMSGQDVSGKPLVIEAEGLLAIVLQHEFDHLQGRLFIDRLSWFRRSCLNKFRFAKFITQRQGEDRMGITRGAPARSASFGEAERSRGGGENPWIAEGVE